MVLSVYLLPSLLSALIVLAILPLWIKKAHKISLIWDDMNKFHSPKVAGSGGVVVVLGFVIGILSIVTLTVFLYPQYDFLIEMLALLTVILMLGIIGIIDDILGWQHGGLSVSSRLVLVALASIPLIAINAGKSTIGLPLLGELSLGVIYPLVMIPIGIVGATTTFNFLAGFNGLEAGQGALLIIGLGIVSYLTGQPILFAISLCMVAGLICFLIWNFTPAKVFPGNSLTYSIGGLTAALAILGNFEKVAIFFFIPYIIETFLKLRGRLKMQSFGKPLPDGSLTLRYNKLYGLEHVAIYSMEKLKIKPTERKVVLTLWAFQLIIILLGFAIFWQGIVSGT